MERKASARWLGSAREGSGTISVDSGTLTDTPYSVKMRFGDAKGTNPEELIAGAHAGCFSMALSVGLNQQGFTATSIDTEARLTLEQIEGSWTISRIHLVTRANVPNIDAAKFAEIAEGAKTNCPVSRVLKAAITLDATLTG
jgi:osmotically inducible protein OsmC